MRIAIAQIDFGEAITDKGAKAELRKRFNALTPPRAVILRRETPKDLLIQATSARAGRSFALFGAQDDKAAS